MKHVEFLALSPEAQGIMLRKYGIRVAVKKTSVFYYVLYQIDNFYVESKFLRGSDEPISTYSFASTLGLEPYLKRVSLDELLAGQKIFLEKD